MTGETRHEPHRIDVRSLGRVGGWLAVGLMAVVTAMYVLWRELPTSPPVPAMTAPGAPLQTHAIADRDADQAKQRQRLAQYRWIDPAHRTAQVPIERAMRIVADDAKHAGAQP